MRVFIRIARLALVATVTSFAAMMLMMSPSSAAEHGPDQAPDLTSGQLARAVAAADTSQAHRLLRASQHGPGVAGSDGATARALNVATGGVPVYGLSEAFVSGASTSPGEFWYVATNASVGAQEVTVYTTRDADGTWQAVNVASGTTESQMARRAGAAKLFAEPQVNAWYAVTDKTIRPLNAAAEAIVGPQTLPIATYQRIVADRYGRSLPGSDYDANGTAGGYDAADTHPKVSSKTRAAETPENGSIPTRLAVGGAVLFASVLFFVRRVAAAR